MISIHSPSTKKSKASGFLLFLKYKIQTYPYNVSANASGQAALPITATKGILDQIEVLETSTVRRPGW